MTILEFKCKNNGIKEVANGLGKQPPEEVVEESSKEEIPSLYFWLERNEVIAGTFHTLSPHNKQMVLEQVLTMNNDLYQLVLELKDKLKEKGNKSE